MRTPPPPWRATAAAARPPPAARPRTDRPCGRSPWSRRPPPGSRPRGRAARGELLDPAVVEQALAVDGVLGEHLGHVAAARPGRSRAPFEHVRVDQGGVGHGGIVIVVPADPSEHPTAAGHGPHAGPERPVELTVADEDTAEHLRSGDVPVLATPRLIALCEEATCRAIDGHLSEAQSSVATRVQFDHLAPVAVGLGRPGRGHLGQGRGPASRLHRLGRPRSRATAAASSAPDGHPGPRGPRPRSWPRRAPPASPERDPAPPTDGRRPRSPARDRWWRVVRHLRPLLGQLGRHALRHPAHVLPQRRPARHLAGGGHRGGRRIEAVMGHSADQVGARRLLVDRPPRLGGAPRACWP